jgi:uncharacterized membrane protein
MKAFFKKLIWLFIFAPVIYLAIIWNKLPETVAVHFNLQGEPDRYGNKSELWISSLLLTGMSIGMYFLFANLHRIDPKRYAKDIKDRTFSIGITIIIFLSLIQFLILYSAYKGSIKFESGLIFSCIGLLFAILGNYMYNIKPNYFVGMRLPWTLENEENWKKTHQLAGRLWFGVGIFLAVFCLLLPKTVSFIVFISSTLLISLIPAIYSYRLFVKQKRNNSL